MTANTCIQRSILPIPGLRRRGRALREAMGALAPRMAPGSGLARPAVQLGSQALGLALLALALARPQCGARTEVTRRYGIDLVVALDVSRSMLARDEAPDRLTRARLEIGALLDRLRGDRVAVVLFAAEPFVQCPLTTDYAAARLLLRSADPSALPRQGTNLAAALEAAGEVLAAADGAGRSRAVVLFSDGEDHEPGVDAAAEALRAEGVRVFTVGLGTPEGVPVDQLGGRGPERPEGRRAPPGDHSGAGTGADAGTGAGAGWAVDTPGGGRAARARRAHRGAVLSGGGQSQALSMSSSLKYLLIF